MSIHQFSVSSIGSLIACHGVVVRMLGDKTLPRLYVATKNDEPDIDPIIVASNRKHKDMLRGAVEHRYPKQSVDTLTGMKIDSPSGCLRGEQDTKLWIVYLSDCAFPRMFLIAADDIEEAIDIAVDEFKCLQANREDYGESETEWEQRFENGTIGTTGSGCVYDSESITCAECVLVDMLMGDI